MALFNIKKKDSSTTDGANEEKTPKPKLAIGDMAVKSIDMLLRRVNYDKLFHIVEVYQAQNGKDATELINCLNGLKELLTKEQRTKSDYIAFAKSVPLSAVLDVAEDIVEKVPGAGTELSIVIDIIRFLVPLKS